MKKTIRENIKTAYSLHDMNVIVFEVNENDMVMRTQSGIVAATEPYGQPDGYVEFHDIDWDFCFVYILDFTGNIGAFTGKKMMLKDFVEDYHNAVFSIIDETYGYNQTKYSGWLSENQTVQECVIEIYHTGDMVFVTEE